jgi:hypothetical protein
MMLLLRLYFIIHLAEIEIDVCEKYNKCYLCCQNNVNKGSIVYKTHEIG